MLHRNVGWEIRLLQAEKIIIIRYASKKHLKAYESHLYLVKSNCSFRRGKHLLIKFRKRICHIENAVYKVRRNLVLLIYSSSIYVRLQCISGGSSYTFSP